MKKVQIQVSGFGHGPDNKVIADGHDISHIVRGFSVNFEVGRLPKVYVDLSAMAAELDLEGDLILNGIKVPDTLARQIYRALKVQFENEHIAQQDTTEDKHAAV